MSTLYAIVFKDTNEILTEVKIREVYPSYGSGSYRVGKKVYFTLGTAKSGYSHLPDKLKSLAKIQEFGPSGASYDGDALEAEYQKRLEKRIQAEDRRMAKLRAEIIRHSEAMRKL